MVEPPPTAGSECPFVRASPERFTVALITENIRAALLPLMARIFAPGPMMVTLLLIASCPPVSVIVPETTLEKTIVLHPPSAWLSLMAWRSEPAPLSLLL